MLMQLLLQFMEIDVELIPAMQLPLSFVDFIPQANPLGDFFILTLLISTRVRIEVQSSVVLVESGLAPLVFP